LDRIVIEDLAVQTVLGVHAWERAGPREVRVGLELEIDLAAAAETDDLENTVDYGEVARRVTACAGDGRFLLLEGLAGTLAAVVLDGFPPVTAVTVRVEKPGALRTGRVRVELRRPRP